MPGFTAGFCQVWRRPAMPVREPRVSGHQHTQQAKELQVAELPKQVGFLQEARSLETVFSVSTEKSPSICQSATVETLQYKCQGTETACALDLEGLLRLSVSPAVGLQAGFLN